MLHKLLPVSHLIIVCGVVLMNLPLLSIYCVCGFFCCVKNQGFIFLLVLHPVSCMVIFKYLLHWNFVLAFWEVNFIVALLHLLFFNKILAISFLKLVRKNPILMCPRKARNLFARSQIFPLSVRIKFVVKWMLWSKHLLIWFVF